MRSFPTSFKAAFFVTQKNITNLAFAVHASTVITRFLVYRRGNIAWLQHQNLKIAALH